MTYLIRTEGGGSYTINDIRLRTIHELFVYKVFSYRMGKEFSPILALHDDKGFLTVYWMPGTYQAALSKVINNLWEDHGNELKEHVEHHLSFEAFNAFWDEMNTYYFNKNKIQGIM